MDFATGLPISMDWKGTRPAVALNTYSSLEGHQLRFDPRHRRLTKMVHGADNDRCTRAVCAKLLLGFQFQSLNC